MSEQAVADFCWHAREVVSSGMGLWGWLWGRRGPSGFGSASTAEEVTAGVDASNLTAIVTGATNGIGKETARVLALRGAKVIIPARTLESGLKVKESLADQVPSSKLHVMEMDLSSLSSVRDFARSFDSSHEHLNLLINNAGIMACPYQLSKDGIELQFATNHVGHFLLTNLLLDKMKSTARETGVQGRIINVSSIAHKRSDGTCFELNKLNDKARYQPFIAYAHSKLANILHANELSRRFQEEGCNLTANSLHPGVIITNIIRYVAGNNNALISVLSPVANLVLKSIPQGAATTCYLALHPNVKDVSGKYFSDCNEATPTAVARDSELAKRLWSFSEELVGINADMSQTTQPTSQEEDVQQKDVFQAK
ncbi:short-chain dehydrogenase TIC 32, chloroplastic-like [Miscanthus floridulus]|uniref:short-chain dehydrogenase TIC 32, chloroplastic-like n=1 Tax=Miscanthus floridulus TaxID=154761 RepID=UPI00345865E7